MEWIQLEDIKEILRLFLLSKINLLYYSYGKY